MKGQFELRPGDVAASLVVFGSLVFLALSALSPLLSGTAQASAPQSESEQPEAPAADSPSLERLSWMAGLWASGDPKKKAEAGLQAAERRSEELWMPPRGRVMLGLHADVSGSGASFFEYLRIESGPEGIVYLAQPMGRRTTPFKLAEIGEQQVVFENLDHDFPQRIIYRLGEQGDRLHARIEGQQDGELRSSAWVWRRISFNAELGRDRTVPQGISHRSPTDPKNPPGESGVSPGTWPVEELARFTALNQTFGQKRPLATGSEVMVAGTSGALAVRAGYEALLRGGSAADAALTTALAQIALAAGSWNSYAGIMTLMYYEASTGQVHYLDAGFGVPRGETDPLSIPKSPEPSGRTALVPGFMAGVEAAHQRFGRPPFDRLFEPAIWIAEHGVELDPVIANLIASKKTVLTRLPEGRRIFTGADGHLYCQGDLFRQPALADTLRHVAEEGACFMYSGAWAEEFAQAVQAEGGTLSANDLAGYRAVWRTPLESTYRGYEVFAPAPPVIGGVHLLEALNVLDRIDAPHTGHYSSSGRALYWLIQTARIGPLLTLMPEAYVKQHLPQIDLSPQARITIDYARMLSAKMQEEGWLRRVQGLPPMPPAEEGGGHSDGVVVVDASGNVAALTHTINTSSWGASGLFVGGVSIPDAACFQQARLAAAGPGGRVPNEMVPLIVLRDGRLRLASSTIGAGLHEATLISVHNVLDHRLDPKAAAEAPIFLSPNWGVGGDGQSLYHQQVVRKGEFPQSILDEVRGLGQGINEVSPSEQYAYRGFWIGITFDAETGTMFGGVCPLLNGMALGR